MFGSTKLPNHPKTDAVGKSVGNYKPDGKGTGDGNAVAAVAKSVGKGGKVKGKDGTGKGKGVKGKEKGERGKGKGEKGKGKGDGRDRSGPAFAKSPNDQVGVDGLNRKQRRALEREQADKQ